jgi:MFS family permease
MDTIGAVLGPLLGVALLGWAQSLSWQDASGPFRLVLWASVVPGFLAVLAFLALVRDPAHSPNPALRFFTSLRGLPPQFKRYLAAVGIFGFGDFSHSLLILAATQLLTPSVGVIEAAQMAGLLYVGRNIVQVTASYPVGALADRWGSLPVLLIGYLLGMATASLMALAFYHDAASVWVLGGIFSIAGMYMAVQEALEATVTAGLVSEETLGTSLGVLGSVNGIAKFVSSTMVGVLWTVVSPVFSFALAAVLMGMGTLLLALSARNVARDGH